MHELSQRRGLVGRIFSSDLAKVGKHVTLQETALGAGGRDLGNFRLGNVLLVQELDDGGVEGVGGVLSLRSGGGLKAW